MNYIAAFIANPWGFLAVGSAFGAFCICGYIWVMTRDMERHLDESDGDALSSEIIAEAEAAARVRAYVAEKELLLRGNGKDNA